MLLVLLFYPADTIFVDKLVKQKEISRKKDIHDLVMGNKTFEQLRTENTAIALSGERIDVTKSNSDLI